MEQIKNLIQHYVLERVQMTCLFVLIDSRLEPQKIDLEFIEWLGENGIPFALVFTKSDKQSAGKTKQNVERFLDTLKEQWEELPKKRREETKCWITLILSTARYNS